MVVHPFYHDEEPGPFRDLREVREGRPVGRGEGPSVELVPGDGLDERLRSQVHGNASIQAGDVGLEGAQAAVGEEQGAHAVAGGQEVADDEGPLGDEAPVVVVTRRPGRRAAQVPVPERHVVGDPGVVGILDKDDRDHRRGLRSRPRQGWGGYAGRRCSSQ